MNVAGASLTLFFCIAVFHLERRRAAVCYLASVLYLTQGQTLDIAAINFMAIRFVELSAFLRLLIKGEWRSFTRIPLDRLLVIFFLLLELLTMSRTGEFDKYGVGNAIDAILVYFAFRVFLRSTDDCVYFFRFAAILFIPIAVTMTVESLTGKNLFATFGGVPEISVFREGHYRAQGSFRNSISAGSLGATFLPIFIMLLFTPLNRTISILGIASSLAILISSRSSGPLMTAITALAACACWSFRNNMKFVRRTIVAILIGLHLVMKQPVWFIFDRISGFVGGDGWHRSNLIDKFLMHWQKWWINGMPIEDTGDWAATKMPWGGVDVTNNYVSIGISGGLASLLLYIFLFISLFRTIGSALLKIRDTDPKHPYTLILWGAGSAVVCHIVNMTAVVYWDQFYVIFYLHLALAASISANISSSHATQQIDVPSESMFQNFDLAHCQSRT